MSNNLKAVVYGRLEEIANAEKITRVQLRELSRELLVYVPDTDDIDIVNRLINVLTPMNAKACVLFFGHFLPWEREKDNDGNHVRFGKRMQGDKKVNKRLELIKEFLADENNNIWTWADSNIEVKQKDFKAMIARTIKKALEGDEKSDTDPLTPTQVIDAVFEGGVTLEQMMEAMEGKVNLKEEKEIEFKHAA